MMDPSSYPTRVFVLSKFVYFLFSLFIYYIYIYIYTHFFNSQHMLDITFLLSCNFTTASLSDNCSRNAFFFFFPLDVDNVYGCQNI